MSAVGKKQLFSGVSTLHVDVEMPTIWVKSNTVDVGVGVGCYVTILSIHLPGSRMWMLSSDNQHPHTKTTKIIKSHLPRISINSSASGEVSYSLFHSLNN